MGSWKWWLEVAGDVYGIGAGIFFTWVFITIYTQGGQMFAVENNPWILIPELCLSIGVTIFMCWHFWVDTGKANDPYILRQAEQAMRNNNDKEKKKA